MPALVSQNHRIDGLDLPSLVRGQTGFEFKEQGFNLLQMHSILDLLAQSEGEQLLRKGQIVLDQAGLLGLYLVDPVNRMRLLFHEMKILRYQGRKLHPGFAGKSA
jgi:hypothetical protein